MWNKLNRILTLNIKINPRIILIQRRIVWIKTIKANLIKIKENLVQSSKLRIIDMIQIIKIVN